MINLLLYFYPYFRGFNFFSFKLKNFPNSMLIRFKIKNKCFYRGKKFNDFCFFLSDQESKQSRIIKLSIYLQLNRIEKLALFKKKIKKNAFHIYFILCMDSFLTFFFFLYIYLIFRIIDLRDFIHYCFNLIYNYFFYFILFFIL